MGSSLYIANYLQVSQIFDKLQVKSSTGGSSKLILSEEIELDVAYDQEKFQQVC